MRYVAAKDLKPGMILGKTLYSNTLTVLLRQGLCLNESHIHAIKQKRIQGIYVDDELSGDITLSPLISEPLKLQFASEVRQIYSSMKQNLAVAYPAFEDVIKKIIDQISSAQSEVINMFELKSFDNYTFQHSIDVCILSILLGLKKQLSYSLLYNLAVSAAFHDIGKLYISESIINKPGSLDEKEFDMIKKHPQFGAEHIKKSRLYRNTIELGILHHHERYDGTGYPARLKGDKISLFGKIVAIADVFDAMTSKRPYKHAMLPSEALEYIMSNAGIHFDYELICLFVNSISAYPVGLTVQLSNGEKAIVAENYEGFTLRPKVKVIPRTPEKAPYYINLKDDLSAQSITIVDVLI